VADELRIGLSELLPKAMIEQDASFLKEGLRVLSEALMELWRSKSTWVAPLTSAAPRAGGAAQRIAAERSWETRVGTVELKVPRVSRLELVPLAA